MFGIEAAIRTAVYPEEYRVRGLNWVDYFDRIRLDRTLFSVSRRRSECWA